LENPAPATGLQLVAPHGSLTVLFAAVFVFPLSLVKCTQFLIPLRFEGVGDQPIFRIDAHIPALREVGFVPNPLDLLFPEAI
jgi:hypothetical protein